MTIFFTSDTHLGHYNIIKYEGRPFDNIFDHDNAIINNWNSVVKPGDQVYHLGDVCLGCSKGYVKDYVYRLQGQIYLIRGNHDKYVDDPVIKKRFVWIRDMHVMRIKKDRKVVQHIVLCHYAMRTWYRSHYGSWQLYGHSHGKLKDDSYLALDVGTNSHNYFPITLEYVTEQLQQKASQQASDFVLRRGGEQ